MGKSIIEDAEVADGINIARVINAVQPKVISFLPRKARTIVDGSKTRSADSEHGFSPGDSSLGLRDGIYLPTGSNVGVRKEGSDEYATAVKQMGVAAGQIADLGHTISDLMCSAHQRSALGPSDKSIYHEVAILGLGDEDFPPILPLPDSGTNRNTSKSVDGSVKTRARYEVNQVDASLGSAPSKTDKEVFGKGSRGTAVVLPSEDAKDSHNWRSLFVYRPTSCSFFVFTNPSTVDGKVIINPPLEAVVEGVGIWEGCLVGQFFDKRLPLHVVKSLVVRLWGKHEIP